MASVEPPDVTCAGPAALPSCARDAISEPPPLCLRRTCLLFRIRRVQMPLRSRTPSCEACAAIPTLLKAGTTTRRAPCRQLSWRRWSTRVR